MRKILFITTTNLAANPRLVKELSLARSAGFDCTVVQFQVGNWSDQLTAELIAEYPDVKFVNLSASHKPFIPWLLSTFKQFLYSRLPLFIISGSWLAIANGKRAWLLLQCLKRHSSYYHWVVAHNPSAFYPAWYYAQKCGAALGVDIEDYHPGETHDKKQQLLMKKMMRKLLPSADYCSYAAPLIAAEVLKDIPQLSNKQLVLLNGFPANEFIQPELSTNRVLRIVWYSQNIDAGRGLEEVIKAVNDLYPDVELHLIGNLKPDFDASFLKHNNGIIIHSPMSQKMIHRFLATCDIGLATDFPVNLNRDLAVTNKIIAYAQAGLNIICFHSRGQLDFLKRYGLHHVVVDNNVESIKKILSAIDKNKNDRLRQQQYIYAGTLDWEELSRPLLKIWQSA
jgi:glycosyltransferase involved in cell wall biosynthesis